MLKDIYYNTISISEPPEAYTNVNKPSESKLFSKYSEELENILYARGSYWNSFHALEYLNPGISDTYNNKIFNGTSTTLSTWLTGKGNTKFQTGDSTQFGHNSYKPTVQNIKLARSAYWTALNKPNDLAVNIAQAKAERFEYHLGWYSPILLSNHRSNLNFARAYQDVTYNPNCDRGVKNRIWVQPLTKPTTEFDEKRCKCSGRNLPLWSAFYCYHNFVEEELGISSEIYNSCIVVVQCPYTFPPLYDKKLPNRGLSFMTPCLETAKCRTDADR